MFKSFVTRDLLKNIDAEENEQHEDYDPWAEDEEKNKKERNKKELGEAMYDPQKVPPRYCWEKPPIIGNGNGRWPPPPLPTHIKSVKESGNKRKRHRQHNPWPCLAAFLEPLYWFRASTERDQSETTSVPGDDITTTLFA